MTFNTPHFTPPDPAAAPIPQAPTPQPLEPRPIGRRRLGRLGLFVSELGLGGAGLHGISGTTNTDATAIATVHAALEAGINYIDTSPGYGESERRLGLALRGYPRNRYVLATKTGSGVRPRNYTADHTYRSVERSLKLLGADYMDLVQVHDPTTAAEAFNRDGCLGALLRLKEQKVIGGIGIGVRSHDLLLQAIRSGLFDTILTHSDFNLIRQTARATLFRPAADSDVGIILGSPLVSGLLSDAPWKQVLLARHKRQPDEEQAALSARTWARDHGLDIVHLALQYCLSDPRISTVLVGAETPDQVRQSIRAVTTPLPPSTWPSLTHDLHIT